MSVKPWKRVEPTIVTKIDWRNVVVKTFEVPGKGKKLTIGTMHLENSRAGGVIALTKDKKVIIARQFRHGPEKLMDEMPGGGIAEGEDSEAGVMRELLEETGYVPRRTEFLGTSCRDAYMNCTWYYYIAYDCELSLEGQQTDEDEQVDVHLVSISEFIQNAKQDSMTDPAAVLMAYDKLKELEKHA